MASRYRCRCARIRPSRAWVGLAGGPFIDFAAERAEVDWLIRELAIRTPNRDAMRWCATSAAGTSRRWFWQNGCRAARTWTLLDEPTVGVDVGAKVEIYRPIDELAGNGAGVLVQSTDLLELPGLCHRILVKCRGRIVCEVPAAETDSDALLLHATGAGGRADAA
jgi:ribose transport system ATP-binding protein